MGIKTAASPQLTVHLMGGLGNQLFQYAFGRSLALANGARLVLDASGYQRQDVRDSSTGVRTCEIEHFNIVGEIVCGSDRRSGSGLAILRRIGKILRLLRRISDTGKPYFCRQEILEPRSNYYHFDPRVLRRKFTGSVYVRGFWQSEKYFLPIEDHLRSELAWHTAMTPENLEFASRIQETTSVAVHVRHGDNARAAAQAMGVLPREYYETTLRALGEELGEPWFFVFSDEIAWARHLLGARPGITYVARDKPGEAHQDLELMAQCKHHIVANSTLSWWGAWLGKKSGQIVYAPRRYFQNVDRPNPDLYPESWRLV